MEKIQRKKRSEARGWKSRQNRDRMQETFVENAENDVDHKNGHGEQDAKTRKRRLKSLRVALESRRGRRSKSLPRRVVYFADRVTDGCAGLQVKGNRYCGKLPQMVDRKRSHRRAKFC